MSPIISNLVLALIPVAIALVAWLYQVLVQRLPLQQRAALHQFSTYAVQKVEQQYGTAAGAQKKQLAEETLAGLFKSFGLPTPDAHALDTAIESAVYVLGQNQEPLDESPLSNQDALSWIPKPGLSLSNPTQQQG